MTAGDRIPGVDPRTASAARAYDHMLQRRPEEPIPNAEDATIYAGVACRPAGGRDGSGGGSGR